MNHKVFGEIKFDFGYYGGMEIVLFGKSINIEFCLACYREVEMFPKLQEEAFIKFVNNKDSEMNMVEELLMSYNKNCKERFTPTIIQFEDNGSYALLFDDEKDLDDSIAVCLSPNYEIISQDDL